MIFKNLLKLIPGAFAVNNFLLERKLLKQFLKCNSLERDQINFYKQFIKPNDLVFDVGANVGSRVKLFLNIGAKVIAFEPQKELCNHMHGYLKRHSKFFLENIALGASAGSAELKISDAHVLSSMSNRWIDATKESGRFAQYTWGKSVTVEMSTLEEKMKKYGEPTFIKIDVEGFELEVLEGLNTPVKGISIEFCAEDLGNSLNCLNNISRLGNYIFNYSEGETLSFGENQWIEIDEFKSNLKSDCSKKPKLWGDIYARLK